MESLGFRDTLRLAVGAEPVVLPRRANPAGTAVTPTYNVNAPNNVLTVPTYREHLTDVFDTRAATDSRALMKSLFVTDPDVSAAVAAFLTVADTFPLFRVYDEKKQIDVKGHEILDAVITRLTTRSDYSKGYKKIQTLTSISEDMRYMMLMRGGIGAELVVGKEFYPQEFRTVDLVQVEWYEKQPGVYAPVQKTADGKEISLDIPTFFTSRFRQDPTSLYVNSPFVSCINTIAARQQVINDLYRIMKLTGYPRLEITVLEEVLLNSAPADIKADATKQSAYVSSNLQAISSAINNIRPDQAFVHTDSVETGMINEKASGNSLNIDSVIETLNAQNQAGLRTMATILGRGTSGTNTASVESRIFSMSAQALNEPLADIWSQMFTMAIRLSGSKSRVECTFKAPELRPDTELEPQLMLRSQRLRQDLSDGIITDQEYHLMMYDRLPPAGAPVLSGTGFMAKSPAAASPDVSPNSDPLGRSVTPDGNGSKAVKDNRAK